MHWVVRDPRAGGWLRSEFEVMSLLDSSGHIFRSHVHVTGKCPPVSQHRLVEAAFPCFHWRGHSRHRTAGQSQQMAFHSEQCTTSMLTRAWHDRAGSMPVPGLDTLPR